MPDVTAELQWHKDADKASAELRRARRVLVAAELVRANADAQYMEAKQRLWQLGIDPSDVEDQ